MQKRNAAFTLVELLVSVGLTAILLWGVVTLYSVATKLAATADAQAALTSTGYALLDRICREVETACPSSVGYLVIEKGQPFDTLRFMAPTPEHGLTHLAYEVKTINGKERMLCRLTKPGTDRTIPTAGGYTIEGPMGVRLDALTIEHCGSAGDVLADGGSWQDLDGTGASSTRYPRSLLITISLSDPKGTTRMTLSSGAVLMCSGP